MELLVHIGLHKTGTTSLQNFFFRNQVELRRYGIYFGFSIQNAHHYIPNVISDSYSRLESLSSEYPSDLDYKFLITSMVNEASTMGVNKILLTSEDFLQLSQFQFEVFLQDMLNQGFEQIKFIVVERDFNERLLTSINQIISGGDFFEPSQHFAEMIEHLRNIDSKVAQLRAYMDPIP